MFALCIANMLELDVKPKPDWGEAEWAGLRRAVREALRRRPFDDKGGGR
jgi:hypothetical protein